MTFFTHTQCLLMALLLFGDWLPADAAERVLPHTTEQRHASVIKHLQQYQRTGEVVPLIAADTPFNGLFLQETSGIPQGGILLLHNDQQHSQWPGVTGSLRQYLPAYGWATLAIELPDQPGIRLPPRGQYQADSDNAEATAPQNIDSTANSETTPDSEATPASETAPAPASDTAPEATTKTATSPEVLYQQQVQQRIAAAVNYLQGRGFLNLVIIAHGNSASWAVNFMLNQQQQRNAAEDTRPVRAGTDTTKNTTTSTGSKTPSSSPGNTLILIDAKQNRYHPLYLEQQLQQLDISILDLITLMDNVGAHHQRRKGMMQHKQRKAYSQQFTATPDLTHPQHMALKRKVRGWLKIHAAGTQLGAKNSAD